MLKRSLQLLLPVILLTALLIGCSDDSGTTPTPTAGLQVTGVTQAPVVDGVVDAIWSSAPTYNVIVGANATYQNAFGQQTVTMKAVSANNTLYVLAQWTDPGTTENDQKKLWSYDGQNWTKSTADEDRFFLMFDASDNGTEGADCATMCHQPSLGLMATTGTGHVDVWHWKAARTNPAGVIDDKWWDATGRGSDASNGSVYSDNMELIGLIEFPKYMHSTGTAYTGKFLFTDDTVAFNGGLNWSNKTIPYYYIDSTATGSRWEVSAKGVYSNGTWTLEMSRALNTGNADDVALGTGTVEASIAITDNSGANHSGSAPFNFVF